MAKRVEIVELKTNTDDAVNDIKKLDKDMTHLADTIGVEVSGSISAMEDKLYELALAGETNTREFKELQEQTARYKKVIIETDRSIDALAEQGRGLSNALAIGEATVAGYQAYAGVTAILGTENEALLETMTKLQAAQGVLNSIMVIKQQMQEKAIVLTNLQTAAQTAYNWAVGAGSIALKVFKLALLATGVGALIVLIGALVSVISSMSKKSETAHEKEERQHKERVKLIEKEKKALEAKAKLQEKLHNQRMGQLNSELELAELRGENTEEIQKRIDAAAIQDLKDKRKNFLDKQKLELKSLENHARRLYKQATMEDAGNKRMAGSNRAYRDQLAVNAKKRKQIQEDDFARTAEFDNKIAIIQQRALNREKEAIDERKAKYREAREERLAKEKEFQEKLQEIREQEAERMNSLLDQIALEEEKFNNSKRQQEENAITDHYFNLITRAEEYGQDVTTLEAARDKKLKELKDGFAKEDEELRKKEIAREREAQNAITDNKIALMKEGQDKEIAALQEKYNRERIAIKENENLKESEKLELLKQLKELEGQELAAINKKWADQEQADRIAAIQGGIDAISAINDVASEIAIRRAEGDEKKQEQIARRAFNVNKALQLATATIQGIQATQNAFATASASPLAIVNPGYPFVVAGIAAATSAANIAKIASARFEGGGGGVSAPSGGGVQGASASSFSIGDNTSTNQTQLNPDGTQANGGQEPVQVFVTESDITETQGNVAQINTLSTF